MEKKSWNELTVEQQQNFAAEMVSNHVWNNVTELVLDSWDDELEEEECKRLAESQGWYREEEFGVFVEEGDKDSEAHCKFTCEHHGWNLINALTLICPETGSASYEVKFQKDNDEIHTLTVEDSPWTHLAKYSRVPVFQSWNDCDSWRELCEEEGLSTEDSDCSTFYNVSPTLFEYLQDAGESTLPWKGLNVWRRETFGQLISDDSVMVRIAKEMYELS